MFLFGKIKLSQSSLFNGYVDCHSHILPGVDDGFQSLEHSLAILSKYESLGVSTVWFTPHIMEDIPNTTAALREKFDMLCGAYLESREKKGMGGKPLDLHLASENMLDGIFEKRLKENDFLPMFENRLLVETSYFNPPMDFMGTLARVKSAGYFPILAHPERYVYMTERDYDALAEMEVLFQLNIFSLVGTYGPQAQVKAERLLEQGRYTYTGTDLHKIRVFEDALNTGIKKKTLDRLCKLV